MARARRLLCIALAAATLIVGVGVGEAQALPTATWTGAGSNGLWSNAGNWQGGIKPVRGAAVTMLQGAPRKETYNDIANLELTSLRVEGRGYRVRGTGSLLLRTEIIVPSHATLRLDQRLTPVGDATAQGGWIHFAGGIAGGHLLTVAAPGGLVVFDNSSPTWTGGLLVRGGNVATLSNAALGPSSNRVRIVGPSSGLRIPSGLTFTHPVDLSDGTIVVPCSAPPCSLTTLAGPIEVSSPLYDSLHLLGDPGARVRVTGRIEGGVMRIRADATELVGPNGFAGVDGRGGPITIAKPSALGPAGGRSTGHLVFPTAMALPYRLGGHLEFRAGASSVSQPLTGTTTFDVVPADASVTLTGAHPALVEKLGAGRLVVTAPETSPDAWLTTQQGVLDVSSPAGQPAAAVFGAFAPGAVIRFHADNQTPPGAVLKPMGGLIDLNGFDQTVAQLWLRTTGTAVAPGTATLTVKPVSDASYSDILAEGSRPILPGHLHFAGFPVDLRPESMSVISLAGRVTDEGGVGFRVGGTNGSVTVLETASIETTGPITVGPSSLHVDGKVLTSTITISPGAALYGGGTVADVNLHGRLAPLKTAIAPSVLTARNVTAFAGSSFVFGLNDTGSQRCGTCADQLKVLGRLDLRALPTLVIGAAAPTQAGAVLTIVNNVLPLPVLGTFKGLPEGSTFTATGRRLQISYRGGNGNDITLRDLGAA